MDEQYTSSSPKEKKIMLIVLSGVVLLLRKIKKGIPNIVNIIPANLSKKFFINPEVFWVKK